MKAILNNSRCQLVGDYQPVIEAFKYMSEGAYYSQLYKSGKWDGYISPVNHEGYFDSGFLPMISREFNLEIDDYRDTCNYQINYDCTEYQLRDYQKEAIDSCFINHKGLPWNRGIIKAATNAGKTAMIVSLANSVKGRVVIVIHNKEIYKQLLKALPGCGVVNSSRVEWGDITLCMYKTLINRISDKESYSNYVNADALICDECHKAGGNDYYKLLCKSNAYFRWGLSGTPLDSEKVENNYRVIGIFGLILYEIENWELIELGHSARPTVRMIDCLDPFPCFTYLEEYQYRVKLSRVRLLLIYENCIPGTLIVVENLDHADFIYSFLNKRLEGCIVLHGDMEDRDNKMSEFISGKWPYVITTRVTQEGIDTPHIRCIIYAKGGKSVTGIKQFAGRGLRKKLIDNTLTIVDFNDSGRWVGDHSRRRYNIYKKEKFEIISK